MLADTRVVYLFIYVSDLDRSREFYGQKLGLQVIEEDEGCVKFDVGQTILALNRASDYGIALPEGRDSSADIVFLVDGIDEVCDELKTRGVVVGQTDRYQPGAITDFYDPDGHWLTLYEPNEAAMSWPSGNRLRAVINLRHGKNGNGHAAMSPTKVRGRGLEGSDLIYVFLFVKHPAETQTFYREALGLRDLEGGPCSRGTEADSDGVVKYDTGGVMLTTHRIYEDRTDAQVDEHMCPPNELKDGWMQTVAPVLYARNLAETAKKISEAFPSFAPKVKHSAMGLIASVDDPSGHKLFLYEPSEEAFRSRSGAKLKELLAVQL